MPIAQSFLVRVYNQILTIKFIRVKYCLDEASFHGSNLTKFSNCSQLLVAQLIA